MKTAVEAVSVKAVKQYSYIVIDEQGYGSDEQVILLSEA